MTETAAFDDPVAARIVAFLKNIGIRVDVAPIAEDTLLPAMTVRRGALLVDPARLEWPGDLLHEAGHIAVTNPAARASLDEVASDPAEEMAAIAWSYAAAVKIDLDPRIVFHDNGYRGGGAYLADAFLTTGPPGLPMLQWYGMTLDARAAKQQNQPAFPHMLRWLR